MDTDKAKRLPVIFRLETKNDTIVAFFPTVAATQNLTECVCYSHQGQHSSASSDYYTTTKPASHQQYTSLLDELKAIYEVKHHDKDTVLILEPVTRWRRSYDVIRCAFLGLDITL
jgi:hypothetical protein